MQAKKTVSNARKHSVVAGPSIDGIATGGFGVRLVGGGRTIVGAFVTRDDLAVVRAPHCVRGAHVALLRLFGVIVDDDSVSASGITIGRTRPASQKHS